MSPTLFQISLYASLALCALGLLWRVSTWFRIRIGPDARVVTASQRVAALFRGAAAALFTLRVFHVLGTLFLDVLLQRRLYLNDKLRWLGHLLIFVGFMALLLMHALAPVVTVKLFHGYESTRDPYLFLRNLFGAMMVIGLALFLFGLWRRRTVFAPVRRPTAAAFMGLLGFVLVTGFLLEADKIASPRAFYRMAKQFNGTSDPAELKPLRAVWAREFGVAFDDLKEPIAPEVMEKGREMHEDDCATCHAKPTSAFVSYPVARMLAPLVGLLDAGGADVWLLYLHVFACFLGLATLPFTRFHHAVAAPVGLLVNGAAPNREFSAAGRASRRALAMDACVHCGICDTHCSVAPLARYLGNPYLLPSHKLIAAGELAGGRLPRSGEEDERRRIAEGAFLCTDCGRCTDVCPVGLDLEDLWQAGCDDLSAAGLPAPAQWVQARPTLAWAESMEAQPWQQDAGHDARYAPLSADRRSFSRCVQCQTCTNVCPVVAHSMDPAYGVDLTPQKVMNLLRLGLRDLTLGSRMVWNCATCYQCQENCPEGIRVADIMVELRALAVRRLGAVRSWRAPS
ncbi:MAG: 4Fe-4S dicluster domain-containing protein [Proteobacteria bacterium]|nr:4Fe-4S dicluster domain-containing protein [Pseudomonadota bacterium]